MYLGHDEIVKLIKEKDLLENVSLNNVQGAGVDLEIEKLYEINSNSYLGIDRRELPEVDEVDENPFVLSPNAYYLGLTKENVNMPNDLVAFMLPRSTLFRSGVSLRTAVIDPGYRGALTVGIKNETDFEFTLEKNARIAQVVFSKIFGGALDYDGKYQGGKVR